MKDYSLLALSYFLKTAEIQHITRTAEKLCISQPSLSRMIASLEDQLEIKLFERKGRNIALTADGETVLRHVKNVFFELQAMEDEISLSKDDSKKTITLSLFAASKILPPILMSFQKKYPSIRLNILQHNLLGNSLDSVKADLVLSSDLSFTETDYSVNLIDEEIMIALPHSHPLAGRKSIALSELSESNFICLQAGKSLRTITDYYCSLAGFTPRITLESDSPETVREYVRAGFGVSFIPTVTWRGMDQGNISLIPISEPRCYRHIILSWREKAQLSEAAELLKDHLIEEFSSFKNNA